jgi:catechol 2,3-dioxygenase-like lactoylglutathione lyase family enzyme
MKFGGVLLYVNDVERSIAFYTRILRLALGARPADHFAILDAEGVSIYLHADPDKFTGLLEGLERRKTRGDGTIMHFNVENVDEWANHCSACGHPISLGPVAQPFGRKQCYIYDPDGYNIVVEEVTVR